jgi:hypothetical protein
MTSSSSSRLKEVTCSRTQDRKLSNSPASKVNYAGKQPPQLSAPKTYSGSLLTVPVMHSIRNGGACDRFRLCSSGPGAASPRPF